MIEELKHTEFAQIHVTDVATRACLARKTFYQHFPTVHALAEFAVERIFQAMARNLVDAQLRMPLVESGMQEQLFAQWAIFSEEIKLFVTRLPRHIFVNTLHNNTRQLYRRILRVNNKHLGSDEYAEYAAGYMAGAIAGIIGTWAYRGFRESPQRVSELTRSLLATDLLPPVQGPAIQSDVH